VVLQAIIVEKREVAIAGSNVEMAKLLMINGKASWVREFITVLWFRLIYKVKDTLLYWVTQEYLIEFISTRHLFYIQTTDGSCYIPLALF